jgi:hypothetical protein
MNNLLSGQDDLVNLGGGAIIENTIVITNGGHSIHAVVAEFTVGGMAAPGQSRVDFWKVVAEQDD